jgi:hypothetical protein
MLHNKIIAEIIAEDDIFAKVRVQINSGVPHQKQAAVILLAVEQLIQKENQESLNPVSYFATLFSLLEDELSKGFEIII